MKMSAIDFVKSTFKLKLRIDGKFYSVEITPTEEEIWVPIAGTNYDVYMYLNDTSQVSVGVFTTMLQPQEFELMSMKVS